MGVWWIDKSRISLTLVSGMSTNYTDGWLIGVDPLNSNIVVYAGEQIVRYSTDRGATWENPTTGLLLDQKGDVTWRGTQGSPGETNLGGGFAFNPKVQGEMLWANGFGDAISTGGVNNSHCI
jgi:hypothetical protein